METSYRIPHQTHSRAANNLENSPFTLQLASQLVCCALSPSPLMRAALPPAPTGVHETPGARCAMVTRNLLMLEDISEMS